jgi:hypothetical protein
VKKLFFLLLFFLSSLQANKVIYLSYEDLPERVIKGEIFTITLKSLSTLQDSYDIHYKFSSAQGVKLLSPIPKRSKKGKYNFDTFHFLSTAKSARLPNIEASLVGASDASSTMLSGKVIPVIALNPSKNFSNIIAKSFKLLEFKTTSYDNEHNIIIFIATAENSNIKALHFKDIYKQGIESITESYETSRITYFVVVDKSVENFTFSYFNTQKNSFSMLNIPVIVMEDSVVTQSDLKPTDQSHERLKLLLAGGISIVLFIFALIRKKFRHIFLALFPLGYMGYLMFPDKIVCVNAGAQIRLLPVSNGTIFETTSDVLHLQKEGSTNNFIKVKLQNEKIGWVKNEDICSY